MRTIKKEYAEQNDETLKSLSAIIDRHLFDREYQIEYKKPSEIAEEEKTERRAKKMEGRGPETLIEFVSKEIVSNKKDFGNAYDALPPIVRSVQLRAVQLRSVFFKREGGPRKTGVPQMDFGRSDQAML